LIWKKGLQFGLTSGKANVVKGKVEEKRKKLLVLSIKGKGKKS